MAHPRINTILVLLAILLGALGCVGYFVPLNWPFEVRPSDWGLLHFFDGRVRLFWIRSPEAPLIVTKYEFGPDFRVKTIYDDVPVLPPDAVGPEPPRINRRNARVRIGNRRAVPDFGGRWSWDPYVATSMSPPVQINYVRLPVWLPVVVLILFPIRSIVRGPWIQRRRQRRNQCRQCGYSLKGLPEPRCPECGTVVEWFSSP